MDCGGDDVAFTYDFGFIDFVNLTNYSYFYYDVTTAGRYRLRWYVDVYVNDTAGSYVGGASVRVYDVDGNIESSGTTNATGWVKRLEATEAIYNYTGDVIEDYNNTFWATGSGYGIARKSVNVTGNMVMEEGDYIYLTLAPFFFTCDITPSSSCPYTRFINLKNDTGGYMNAHAQNVSLDTYPYTICCNSSVSTLDNSCSDAVVLRLSDETNAHVQVGNYSGANSYPVDACLSSPTNVLACLFPNDECPGNYFCVASMASSYASDNNETNAHVGPCSEYRRKVCCKVNYRPEVNLSYPTKGDDSFINRTPCFNWTGYDGDGDELTYHFQLCYDSNCTSLHTNVTGIAEEKYCIQESSPLDLGTWFWRVRANDSFEYGEWSETWNFTIVSYVSINLTVSSVSFGVMQPGTSDDTADGSPQPFIVENAGNVKVNVSVNATPLWSAVGMPSTYYQFKANRSASEPYSFDYGLSTTAWEPFTNTSYKLAIAYLNWSDASDEAALDIYIEARGDEPPGDKNSTVVFYAEEAGP